MADFDDIDALLSSSLKSAAEPANSAGVADAIRSRVAAGDAGTSVAGTHRTGMGWWRRAARLVPADAGSDCDPRDRPRSVGRRHGDRRLSLRSGGDLHADPELDSDSDRHSDSDPDAHSDSDSDSDATSAPAAPDPRPDATRPRRGHMESGTRIRQRGVPPVRSDFRRDGHGKRRDGAGIRHGDDLPCGNAGGSRAVGWRLVRVPLLGQLSEGSGRSGVRLLHRDRLVRQQRGRSAIGHPARGRPVHHHLLTRAHPVRPG